MAEIPAYMHARFGGQCQPGDIAPYVLAPGSARRAEMLAADWQTVRQVVRHFEFAAYTGLMRGVPITACSTGIGGTSTSIAVDELAALGAHTFLRVGVTGALQPQVAVGDLIIASAAVRMDKVSEHYAPLEYPAVAHFEIISALIAAAERLGYPYHVGIVATSSSFSVGEGNTGFGGYRHSKMDHIAADLTAAGVYDWDTETATLLTLCSLYGLRAGRVNAVVDDPATGKYNPIGEARAVRTALAAMAILAEWDSAKTRTGRHYSLPAANLGAAE